MTQSIDAPRLPRDGPPVELTTRIIALMTESWTSSRSAWRSYHSLIRVSSQFQAIAYAECIPHLPVMLHTRNHVYSFEALLKNHPYVGPKVRALWFIAAIKASEEHLIGGAILAACPQLTRLACNINLLECMVDTASHRQLRDLTLVENIIPWERLLRNQNARLLFNELTHFRSSGGQSFTIPDFCFTSLAHLSFACHDLTLCCTSFVRPGEPMFGPRVFPGLRRIVPTIPYITCRYQDSRVLRSRGSKMDARVDVIPCPKKWKEADVWLSARWGADLWERAALGEDVTESRADKVRQAEELADEARFRRNPFADFDDEAVANILNAMEG
jgi:hypothetical protein